MKPKATTSLTLPLIAGALTGLVLSNNAFAQQQTPNHTDDIQRAVLKLEEVSQATDPASAYEHLTEEEKRTIQDNLFIQSVTTDVGPAINLETGAQLSNIESSEIASLEVGQAVPYARFEGCWRQEAVGVGVNTYGVTGVMFGQTTEVCVR